MNTASESIRVVINGNEYSIKADVESDTIKRVAEYVNQKMDLFQQHSASRDKLKVAVLSAMNIAGELFEYRDRLEENMRKLDAYEQRVSHINRKLNCLE